jgi:DMSO reductase anchor subunit
MSLVNKICFTICIVTIALGVVLGLSMIWCDVDSEYAWKTGITLVLFFISGASVGAVNTFFKPKNEP